MQYGDFGLQATRRSREPGRTEPTHYCPWTRQTLTGRHFYLCFSNWVISQTAIDAFLKQSPDDPQEIGDRCQKCNQPQPKLHYNVPGYRFDEEGMFLGICPDCVHFADQYMKRPITVPTGTQLTLF